MKNKIIIIYFNKWLSTGCLAAHLAERLGHREFGHFHSVLKSVMEAHFPKIKLSKLGITQSDNYHICQ